MAVSLNNDEIATWAAEQTCPVCSNKGFRVEWRLVAKPQGSYSLAGVQDKVAATETPFIVCGLEPGQGCGAETSGTR